MTFDAISSPSCPALAEETSGSKSDRWVAYWGNEIYVTNPQLCQNENPPFRLETAKTAKRPMEPKIDNVAAALRELYQLFME